MDEAIPSDHGAFSVDTHRLDRLQIGRQRGEHEALDDAKLELLAGGEPHTDFLDAWLDGAGEELRRWGAVYS